MNQWPPFAFGLSSVHGCMYFEPTRPVFMLMMYLLTWAMAACLSVSWRFSPARRSLQWGEGNSESTRLRMLERCLLSSSIRKWTWRTLEPRILWIVAPGWPWGCFGLWFCGSRFKILSWRTSQARGSLPKRHSCFGARGRQQGESKISLVSANSPNPT